MLKKFATVLLHLAMLALVCAIAAYWVIRIMTAAPTSSPPPQPASAPREADPQLAARMFGLVQSAPMQLATNVEVIGVFAADRDSSAILAVDGKPARVFLLDQDVVPGAKLTRVRKDGVTIERGGVSQDIAMPPRQELSLGGPPPAPGFTREGNTLTAPAAGSPSAPAGVPPRPLPQSQPPPPPQLQQPPPQPQPPVVPSPGQPLAQPESMRHAPSMRQ